MSHTTTHPSRVARRRLLAAALCAIAVLAAACGDDSDPSATAEGSDLSADIEAALWVLDGEASTPATTDAEGAVTIAFEGDSVHGTGPCNTYGGPAEVGSDSVSLGPLASTMRSCGDAVDAAEADFFAALESVDSAEIDGDGRLVLSGPDDVELIFDGVESDELLAGTWAIVDIATDDAIVSPIEGTEPTITFDEDGNASAETGCNDLATTWESDGDALTFGEVAQTMMACAEPEGVTEQEAAIAAALTGASTFEVTPDRVTILGSDGNILLVAVPS